MNFQADTFFYMAIIFVLSLLACVEKKPTEEYKCSNNSCSGTYTGPEFMNGSDVAHQFSNTMCRVVGNKLKDLYKNGHYAKVGFEHIRMSTKGMGTGQVEYTLSIPFLDVKNECDAYTSFDHVGGWNHSPELSERMQQLNNALMPGHKLEISALKTTKEGLQEYWIQWKNKKVQAACK